MKTTTPKSIRVSFKLRPSAVSVLLGGFAALLSTITTGRAAPILFAGTQSYYDLVTTNIMWPAAQTDTDVDKMVKDYDEVCDYYLFDKATDNSIGGTGKQFDWNILAKAKIEKPFFLSGGIGPDDAGRVKAFKHPDFFAVDINSRFEKEPGMKDMGSILQFRLVLKGK